jgi:hypothetical protein
MTLDELIEEGRRIQRPTVLLEPEGEGDVAAIWYGRDHGEETSDHHQCWLSVKASAVPSYDLRGWISVFTDEELCSGGRIETSASPWSSDGIRLYPTQIEVLPPIDAIFMTGSSAVEKWLVENKWERDWGYNSNFRDSRIVDRYESLQQAESPLFRNDAYATLGGWHIPWPDDDWNDLLDAKLLVQTYRDSEPWVEAWRLASGELKVLQRIT